MLFHLSLVLCALQLNVAKADLDVSLEDAECLEVNSKYIETCDIEAKDDSTYGSCLDTTIIFIEQLPDNALASGHIMGYSHGSYDTDLGIDIEGTLCDFTNGDPTLATPILNAVGITPDNCPPEVGTYEQECYFPIDSAGMPASFPGGKYLLNLTLYLPPSEVILKVFVYVTF